MHYFSKKFVRVLLYSAKGFFVKKWLLSNFCEKQKFNDDAQQTKSRKQFLRNLLCMESINTGKRLDQTLSKCYQY